MPLFEYHCKRCKTLSENFYPTFSKAPREIQCVCGSPAKRVISLPVTFHETMTGYDRRLENQRKREAKGNCEQENRKGREEFYSILRGES